MSAKATVEHMATLRVIEYDRSNDLEKQEGTILRISEYCKLKLVCEVSHGVPWCPIFAHEAMVKIG